MAALPQLRDAQLETVQTRVERPIPVALPAEGSPDGYIEWLTKRAKSVHRTVSASAFVAEAAHRQCRGSIGGQRAKHAVRDAFQNGQIVEGNGCQDCLQRFTTSFEERASAHLPRFG